MDNRDKLGLFFRTVRKAQKKSQLDVTSDIKDAEQKEITISQAALAKFESNKAASLSTKKLSLRAPKLNINPDYVLNGFGNPFKPASLDSIIKMFFPEDTLGNIDFWLIDLIIESNPNASLLALKPSMLPGADRRLLRKRGAHHLYGLVIKDSEDNLILFRREDKDEFFDEFELQRLIKGRPVTQQTATIDPELFAKMREKWSELNNDDIRPILESIIRREDIIFLKRLINKVSSDQTQLPDKEEYERISKKIGKLDNRGLAILLEMLLPEIGKVLKNITRSIY